MDQAQPSRASHSRTFSYRSNRSDKSASSRTKEEVVESPKEKQFRDSLWKGGHKANPNNAITEAQPGVNAVFEQTTLTSLRGIQHKDGQGNIIMDPDLSNPTRPRLERPLDTIRSFEKAIDSGYKRRSSYNRSESFNQQDGQYGGGNRNSGYGFDNGSGRPTTMNGGYYGGQRQESYSGSALNPQRRQAAPRMHPEPQPYGQPRPYAHGPQQSQDTLQTGVTNGSDSTGPWANGTDPSSENSSLDKVQPAPRNLGDNGHAYNGYQQGGFQGPIPEEGGFHPMRNGGAPPVQPPPGARRPIPLGNSGESGAPPPASADYTSQKRPEPEKRKSWLKRAFSRKD